ncbi:MAG: winged helix-turn-helix transcriptional regulator [Gammaproteobacteria bacterium]|uniref:winged helix-turn-helix transcriptional regulator n=1 Tax=Acidithiobacillus ferrooxidans TaxID=920 RepID=UPI001D00CA36|nr:winged helix-turn-helix transcriptional regulator [Acidithiobacillus ferrooxidans]MCL4526005.1 winged helix-turn-helix transcriptional regulator [Gammaproteobacteria bacterium]
MLAQQLREMERHGIVNRLVYAEVPPRSNIPLPPGEEFLARPHGDAPVGVGAVGGDGGFAANGSGKWVAGHPGR